MNCYKGKCFCPFYTECQDGRKCDRAKTPTVIKGAEIAELDIDTFMDKPECFVFFRSAKEALLHGLDISVSENIEKVGLEHSKDLARELTGLSDEKVIHDIAVDMMTPDSECPIKCKTELVFCRK